MIYLLSAAALLTAGWVLTTLAGDLYRRHTTPGGDLTAVADAVIPPAGAGPLDPRWADLYAWERELGVPPC